MDAGTEEEESGDEADLNGAGEVDETQELNRAKRYKYKFNPEWQKTFPWLIFENDLMYCKYCKGQASKGGHKSAFVSGNS